MKRAKYGFNFLIQFDCTYRTGKIIMNFTDVNSTKIKWKSFYLY